MSDTKIEADADVAARYLVALLNRGVERADAVSLTSGYMTTRAMMETQRAATKPIVQRHQS